MHLITPALSWLRGLLGWSKPQPRLRVSASLWASLLRELRIRGLDGSRESGAFLLGERDGDRRTVIAIAYLDDLDPNCLVGSIHFAGEGYTHLWQRCRNEGLVVLGDVHTHPGRWIAQSEIDRANPMVARTGHIALVLPNYALGSVAVDEISANEYLGEAGWKTWIGQDVPDVVEVVR